MDMYKKKGKIIVIIMLLLTTITTTMIIQADPTTTISFEDMNIPQGSTKNIGLFVNNVNNLGSFEVRIKWNPTIIDIKKVTPHDGFEVTSYIKNNDGYANLAAYTLTNPSGNIQPAIFQVKAIGTVGESCILQIDSSELLSADPSPITIDHSVDHGLITVEKKSSSSGGSDGGGEPPITNIPPVCDASLSDAVGFIGEQINFDGSESYDSDGSITSYNWNFGDGESGSGMITSHMFSQPGWFEVSLTIKDNQGASTSDTIQVTISKSGNNPPDIPTITGPDTGSVETEYEFSFSSADSDGDNLRFLIEWSDGESSTSEFDSADNATVMSHQWLTAGRFVISVRADDNKTISASSSHVILIDAIEVIHDGEMLGVVSDNDGDGIYDQFEADDNAISYDKTKERYLLDTDMDTIWDYYFDAMTGETSDYNKKIIDNEPTNLSWLLILVVIGVIMVIGIAMYLMRSTGKKK